MCSIRHKATLQSSPILLSYEKFVREFDTKKKDKYWLIKSWLHRRRSAHLDYTVVQINNNHQDTPNSININKTYT